MLRIFEAELVGDFAVGRETGLVGEVSHGGQTITLWMAVYKVLAEFCWKAVRMSLFTLWRVINWRS